jgi:hypothetical protein
MACFEWLQHANAVTSERTLTSRTSRHNITKYLAIERIQANVSNYTGLDPGFQGHTLTSSQKVDTTSLNTLKNIIQGKIIVESIGFRLTPYSATVLPTDSKGLLRPFRTNLKLEIY